MEPSNGKDKSPKEQTVKNEPGQVAYVGPNIRQPVHITQYQVFRNGLPKEVDEYLKKKPELEQFLVPVEDLSAALAELKNPESLMTRKFLEVKGGR